MKIAIISHLRFPIAEPFAGGLEAHTHRLAEQLTARGHDVTVFGAMGTRGNFKVVRCKNAAHSLTDEVAREAGIARGYHAIMDRIEASDFDLVHNNSLNHVPMIRANALGTPYVQVLHSPLLPNCEASAPLIRAQGNPRLVAVSELTRRAWSKSFVVEDVVHNGVDPMRWRYSSRPVPELVAYVGRVVPEKGVHHAIDAARLAGKQLLIAGPLSDLDYYNAEIEPRLDEERRYAGHLSSQQTAHLLSNAECSLFTSVWPEPFGLVLAESLACGTPVAGFDVGAAREVLTDQTGVLVEQGDTAALAEAIAAATQLDRATCRREATTRFSVTAMVDQYEDIYAAELRKRATVRLPLQIGLPGSRDAASTTVLASRV